MNMKAYINSLLCVHSAIWDMICSYSIVCLKQRRVGLAQKGIYTSKPTDVNIQNLNFIWKLPIIHSFKSFFLFCDKVLYAFYQVHLLKPPKKDSEIFQHHELYNINNKYIKNQQKNVYLTWPNCDFYFYSRGSEV